jgi:hypothetical protein
MYLPDSLESEPAQCLAVNEEPVEGADSAGQDYVWTLTYRHFVSILVSAEERVREYRSPVFGRIASRHPAVASGCRQQVPRNNTRRNQPFVDQ